MAQCSLVLSFLSFFFAFFISPREDQTELKAYHRFKDSWILFECPSNESPSLEKKQKNGPIKGRQGTLAVFYMPSSSLWASLTCLPQFWLPPAVSFSPLHWRGFWLADEAWVVGVVAGDPKHRPQVWYHFLPCILTRAAQHLKKKKKTHRQCKHLHKRHLKLQQLSDFSMCCGPGADPESVLGGCSPPSRLLLVINVCTDITPYFKGLLTQQRVALFSTHNLLIRTITCNSPACEKAA